MKEDSWFVEHGLLLPLFNAPTLDALTNAVFTILHATVPCHFVSAFYRGGEHGLQHERDSLGRTSDPEFMRRYTELTPALPFALAHPGVEVMTTRDLLPSSTRAVKRSAFYREVMRPQGWRHSAALCFWGDPAGPFPLFVASVNRTEQQGDLTPRHVSRLRRVHPFIDSAVTRIFEREMASSVQAGMSMVAHEHARGFVILSQTYDLLQANGSARELAAAWTDAGAGDRQSQGHSSKWRPPAAVVSECRALRREWQASPDAAGTAGLHGHRRLVHPLIPGLTATITMIRPTTGLAEPIFLIEFERRVHGIPLEVADASLPVFKTLTAAERGVATVLADGFSNQEIADHIGKSVHAVKFLLHSIYEKTGIPSRAALVAVLRARRQSLS
jgi:DNA-binding CsgD family transcriptional regulator